MMEKLGDFLSSEHSVLIPDLLGHGQSDLPKIDYSIEILADTLLDLCKSSGLDEIIYTAHERRSKNRSCQKTIGFVSIAGHEQLFNCRRKSFAA